MGQPIPAAASSTAMISEAPDTIKKNAAAPKPYSEEDIRTAGEGKNAEEPPSFSKLLDQKMSNINSEERKPDSKEGPDGESITADQMTVPDQNSLVPNYPGQLMKLNAAADAGGEAKIFAAKQSVDHSAQYLLLEAAKESAMGNKILDSSGLRITGSKEGKEKPDVTDAEELRDTKKANLGRLGSETDVVVETLNNDSKNAGLDLVKGETDAKKNTEQYIKSREVSAEKILLKTEASADGPAIKAAIIEKDHADGLKTINPTDFENESTENHPSKGSPRISAADVRELAAGKDSRQQNPMILQDGSATREAASIPKIEAVQSFSAELNERSKSETKSKNVPRAIMDENVSLNSLSSPAGTVIKEDNINPQDLINRVANEIKESAAVEGGRVRITLNPSSLGTLEMDVIVRNNKVEVILTAGNRDVQQTLSSQLDQLKNTLSSQGLTIERCDVLMQDRHDELYRSFGSPAFFQERSSREGKGEKQDNGDEKIISIASIDRRSGSALKESSGTNNISLFA